MLDQLEAIEKITHTLAFKKLSNELKKEVLADTLIVLHDLESSQKDIFNAIFNNPEDLNNLINRIKLKVTFFDRESDRRVFKFQINEFSPARFSSSKVSPSLATKPTQFYEMLRKVMIEKGVDKLIK